MSSNDILERCEQEAKALYSIVSIHRPSESDVIFESAKALFPMIVRTVGNLTFTTAEWANADAPIINFDVDMNLILINPCEFENASVLIS
jgi:hypothetical protein